MKDGVIEEGNQPALNNEKKRNDSADLPIMVHITLPLSWNHGQVATQPVETKPETTTKMKKAGIERSSSDKRASVSISAESCKRPKAKIVKQKSQFQIECERFLHNANKSRMLKRKKRV